ncbi:MAG: hypothetical protein HY747_00465 [Elusimicrobia bacterium]|nr:hypothetical protein [Elusimicrobiota bacterium]
MRLCWHTLLRRPIASGRPGQAGKSGAKYALIIGEDEAKNKNLIVKDLASGNQSAVVLAELVNHLTPTPPSPLEGEG